jgi:hypothetical protein
MERQISLGRMGVAFEISFRKGFEKPRVWQDSRCHQNVNDLQIDRVRPTHNEKAPFLEKREKWGTLLGLTGAAFVS